MRDQTKLRVRVRSSCVDVLTIACVGAVLSSVACGVPEPSSSAFDELQAPAAAPPIAQTLDDWHAAMQQLAQPGQGCFRAEFPHVEWQQVACAAPPDRPYPPTPGGRPQTVGNGVDWSARVSAGTILTARGSFDTVSGVTSITSVPSGGVSEFSLQLNSQFFVTPTCAGSADPAVCRGWQQFVYSNTGVALMQYWLIRYDAVCPAGWNTFPIGTSTYCWKNGSVAVPVPPQAVANLGNLRLSGTAVLGGVDVISFSTGTTFVSATNSDGELDLAAGWTDAEFNVFGDCCASQATFNAGSTVVARTEVVNGAVNTPICMLEGFTAETNNLTLVGTPALGGILSDPVIVFQESNIAPFTAASCATGTGDGDPHLTTFLGTYYDFQGIGDYLLAQRGANFVVQTRQISGAPTWPNAAVNKEVATRMGKSRIAVCSLERLEINGKATSLADGKQISLPDATLERHGNVYLITGHSGDSVRAEVNPGYIDVQVGLGQWPDTVLGLLGNGKTAAELVARDGTVLPAPVAFQDLYGKFGDSWRVAPKDSLLCSNEQVERRNPDKPFCVKDLDPKIREHAQGVCAQFGIKQGPLFDACVLDVAMLGDAAARAFVNAPPPVVVGDAACR